MTTESKRQDGRSPSEPQEIFIQKGIKHNCTSSVYIETTHMKLLCSIIGPVFISNIRKNEDVTKMKIKVNLNIPSYLVLPINPNSLELQIESLISQNILTEKYSKTKLTVNLDLFETNCNILAYSVMAISLALTEANIEQKGIITCASLCVQDGSILIDPTFDEEAKAQLKLTFGCIVDLQENNLFLQEGNADEVTFNRTIANAISVCEKYQNYIISKM